MALRTLPRPLRLLALITTAVAVVSSCSSSSGSDSGSTPSATGTAASAASPVTPRTMPEGKGSGEKDGVFPRTVVHFAGETKITAAPKRVVTIATGQADALLTLGVVPVGSASGEGAQLVPKYLLDGYPQFKAQLSRVASVGVRTAPDVESIANLKPDLILMNVAGDDAQALAATLSAIAPTVATQGTGLYWKQDFLLLADALGKEQQAQTWLDEYQQDAAAFGAGLTTKPTVSFLRLNADRTRVFGVASFSGSVAEDAGLPRPKSQSFTDKTSLDISAEQLDLADGDRLFYGVQGGDATALTKLPLWPTLGAVAAGQTLAVDDDAFYLNAGPTAARLVLTVLQQTLAGEAALCRNTRIRGRRPDSARRPSPSATPATG